LSVRHSEIAVSLPANAKIAGLRPCIFDRSLFRHAVEGKRSFWIVYEYGPFQRSVRCLKNQSRMALITKVTRKGSLGQSWPI
jgi:hypothetical protein